MNFIVFILIVLLTFIISQFAMSQIVGIIFFKLPKKEFSCLIGLIIWLFILYIIYLIITKWFDVYYYVYLITSIISFVIVLFNIKNLKDES